MLNNLLENLIFDIFKFLNENILSNYSNLIKSCKYLNYYIDKFFQNFLSIKRDKLLFNNIYSMNFINRLKYYLIKREGLYYFIKHSYHLVYCNGFNSEQFLDLYTIAETKLKIQHNIEDIYKIEKKFTNKLNQSYPINLCHLAILIYDENNILLDIYKTDEYINMDKIMYVDNIFINNKTNFWLTILQNQKLLQKSR